MTPERRDALRRRIRDKGLRATRARIVVLRFLEDAARPVTHAEASVGLRDEGLDRATVFRNLVALTEAGVARRADLGDHVWRFELVNPDSTVLFVCGTCGAIERLSHEMVRIIARRGSPRALRRETKLHIIGTCDSCAS